jgi:hypothetical protein
MTPKSIMSLAAITIIVFAAAVVGVSNHYGSGQADAKEVLLYPGLEEKLNRVTEIEIVHGEGKITLRREGEKWTMLEKGGYPVLADKARKAAIHVSQFRVLEAKTRRPELFDRLQLEDVDTKDAKSKLLRLKSAGGEVLAEAIIGKSSFVLGGLGHAALYVRKSGTVQAWKVKSGLDASTYTLDWLPKNIMDISEDRVMRVSAMAADGSRMNVSRAAPADGRFTIEDLPSDAVLADDAKSKTDDMVSALSGMDMMDVAKASEMDFSGDDVARAEVRTFDGLVIRASIIQRGEWAWARFEADAQEPSTTAAPGTSAEKTAKEAAAINERVGGWAYKLPDNKGRHLRTRLADLMKKKKDDKPS